MSLRLLLDENLSQIIAHQVKRHRPAQIIESVHTWRDGAFRGRSDGAVLQAAYAESLTLVTCDQKTIPPLLAELYADGQHHAGIVFVDRQTIPSNDFGAFTRALIVLCELRGGEEWQDRILFLKKPLA